MNSAMDAKSAVTVVLLINQDWAFLSHRLALARALKQSGAKVIVATCVDKARGLIEAEGFIVHHIPFKRAGIFLISEFFTLLAIIRLYLNIKPDVVHQVALKAVIYGSIAAKIARTRAIVNTISGLGYVFTTKTLKTMILRVILKALMRVTFAGKRVRVVFQNPDDHELFLRQAIIDDPARTSLILGSGVDLKRFHVSSEPTRICTIVVPARMLKEKGIFEAVEAAQILRRRGFVFEMHLCGGVDLENPGAISEAQLRSWSDQGVVRWLGHQTSMDKIFQEANIVCLPSYREGLPLALIEAAASGRAMVATDVPGCRHVVINGKTGLLVPAKDSEQLAEALAKLIVDADYRRELGANARTLAECEFSNEQIISKLWRLYVELLSGSEKVMGQIPFSDYRL